MRLTAKSSYGVRALISLAAMYDGGNPVSIKYISQEEGLSNIYLDQIFNQLKKHGLVKSIRGPKGGYILTKDPSKVSVYEVVLVLEGSVSPARCFAKKGEKKVCANAGRCASKEVWDEVAKNIEETLRGFSLKNLADRALEIDPKKFEKARRHEKSLS